MTTPLHTTALVHANALEGGAARPAALRPHGAAALACAAVMTLAMLAGIGLLAETDAAAPQWAQSTTHTAARG